MPWMHSRLQACSSVACALLDNIYSRPLHTGVWSVGMYVQCVALCELWNLQWGVSLLRQVLLISGLVAKWPSLMTGASRVHASRCNVVAL